MAGRSGVFLIAVLAFALIVRVAATARFVGLDSVPDADSNPDQVDYEDFASQLAAGNGYRPEDGELTARRPPGTSLSLWPVYAVTGRCFLAGRLWFCFLSALSAVLAGLVCGRFFGMAAGRWTAVGLALYPGHFYYAMHFLSEPAFGLFTAAFCGLSFHSLRGPFGAKAKLSAVGAGMALGLSILTRPQALLMIPLGAALLVVVPRLRRRQRWVAAAIQLVVAAAILLPWVIRNHQVVGKATISTIGGYTFWGANNAIIDGKPHRRGSWMPVNQLIKADTPVEGTEVEREAATWEYGKRFLRENPERIPGLLAMKVVRLGSPFRDTPNRAVYWAFALSWMVAAPLVVAGIFLAWRRNRGATAVLLLPVFAVLATALVFYGSTRFRDSICVVLISFAGVSLSALQERLCRRKAALPT